MKIFPDECLTKRLNPYLAGFEVFTESEMKWPGIKNGGPMAMCSENAFEHLLTIDTKLMFQQNLKNHKLTTAVLNSLTSKLTELVLFIPSFKSKVADFKKIQGLYRKVRQTQNKHLGAALKP